VLAVAATGALLLGASVTLLLTPARSMETAARLPAATPATATVTVSLTSDPPLAEVYRAGQSAPLGRTPMTVTLPRGRTAVELRIAKEGFVPAQLMVVPDQSRPFLVSLAPLPPPPGVESQARRPRPRRNEGNKIRNAVPIDPFAP
jgi:hypothetical protein